MIERSSRLGMNISAGAISLNRCMVESGFVSFDTGPMSPGARLV